MHVIYKQILGIGEQTLELPRDARILCVQNQSNQIMIWYEVGVGVRDGKPLCEYEKRVFGVYGTGHIIKPPRGNRTYLGTVQIGEFVWHVFHLSGTT